MDGVMLTPKQDQQNKSSKRYDRQLRLWGDAGQAALENSHVCLINASAVGTEVLKALVLGGVGRITVVDSEPCSNRDLGENYAIESSHVEIGKSRSAAVTESLLRLNDAVTGSYVEDTLANVVRREDFFRQFTLVVATQLREGEAIELDSICRRLSVKALFVRSYGMIGAIRASVEEHCVVESKPDHLPHDLRLADPWPELLEYARSFNLNGVEGADGCAAGGGDAVDDMTFKHTPYVVILIRMLENWKRSHGGSAPSTSADLKEIKASVRSMDRKGDAENVREAVAAAHRVLSTKRASSSASPHVPPEVDAVLNDHASLELGPCSSTFWIVVSAIREFVYGAAGNDGAGYLPLDGSLPDMTSFTEFYLALQELYAAKAAADAAAVQTIVRRKLFEIGREADSISTGDVKHMCKNVRCLAVARHATLADEVRPEDTKGGKIKQLLEDEATSSCTIFYLLLRAVDLAYTSLKRFPGELDGESEDDAVCLRTSAASILSEYGLNQNLNLSVTLLNDYIKEVCRFGGAELHVVSAIVGGIAAQESLKLVLGQYAPVDGTYMFDAINMLGTSVQFCSN